MSTKIISVIHEDGLYATAQEIWGQPNSGLFEIAEGPHQGKRGPDNEIYNLVGPIEWDKEQVSVYETGQILSAWMCPQSS